MEEKKEKFTIFIVEDDYFCNKLVATLVKELVDFYSCPDVDFEVHSYISAQEGKKHLDLKPNVMILDYYHEITKTNDVRTAGEIIHEVKETNPDCKIIMFSALNDVTKIVELIKLGAYYFVNKDEESLTKLRMVLKNIISDFLEQHYSGELKH